MLFPHRENVGGREFELVFLNTQTQQSLYRLKSLSHRKRTLPQQIRTGRTPEEHGYLFQQNSTAGLSQILAGVLFGKEQFLP